jgi:hypothetical protein
MARRVHAIVLVLFSIFSASRGTAQTAQPADIALASVLRHLSDSVQQYYDRFTSIICTEEVHQQDLRSTLQPVGKPRVTVYELSVSRGPASKEGNDFRVERTMLSVNGRRARKNQEPGCTDPKTGTPEPLAFLLAKNQAKFRFKLNAAASEGPPGASAVDFAQFPPDRVHVKWTGDCIQAEGGGEEGRVWFDPLTFEVLQVDIRLPKPFPVRRPDALLTPGPSIWVERWEMRVRFVRVAFENPEETVLLPASVATLAVFRGAPSWRMNHTMTDFRRFLAESTMRPTPF